MARILFPLSFGLFNLTYWYSYFHAQKPFDWDDHMLKGKSIFLFSFFSYVFIMRSSAEIFSEPQKAKKKANYRGLRKCNHFCYVLIFLFFSWKSLSLARCIFDPKIHMGQKYIFFTCASEYHSASWCLKILLNVSFWALKFFKKLKIAIFSLRNFLDFQTLWTYCQNTNYFFADNQNKNCYLLYI